MKTSDEGKRIIEECFVSIGGVKSFTSFTRLSQQQQECIAYLKEHADAIESCKGRDVHLKELIFCITGNDSEDADEPLGEGAFSQYRFYRTYIHDLVFYPEKFDFLLKCIEESVCTIRLTSRFMKLVDTMARSGQVDTVPDNVMHYDRLLEEDEEHRIESFTLRKDWVCKVPHYLEGIGGDARLTDDVAVKSLREMADEMMKMRESSAREAAGQHNHDTSSTPSDANPRRKKSAPKESEKLRFEMEKLIRACDVD